MSTETNRQTRQKKQTAMKEITAIKHEGKQTNAHTNNITNHDKQESSSNKQTNKP